MPVLVLPDIRLEEKCGMERLRQAAAGALGVPEASIGELKIHRLSVDARRKPRVCFVYTLLASVADEGAAARDGFAVYAPPEPYSFPAIRFPAIHAAGTEPPVVIAGTGPAGLFAALCLAEAGAKCVVLERGQPLERRVKDVSRFWSGGGLDASSNVQFGEGGAGTFSDGKLTTGISDRRTRFVLERFARYGAPEEILYLSKPHIGTDELRGVVRAITDRLVGLGCDIRFGHRLADLEISGGALRGATVEHDGTAYEMAADKLVLALGNSARDTFEMLHRRGVRLAPKSFSVGLRVEHLQSELDRSQYGRAAACSGKSLPASDYKMAVNLGNGRAVYTFCVCPGGRVVAAASEQGGVVTNGMSMHARDGENVCGAILVSVSPEDFGQGALGGVEYQRMLERAAFAAGGGDYSAPAQLVGDFLEKRASTGRGNTAPTYLPGVRYCNLWDVLPGYVCEAISEAWPRFSSLVACFSDPGAVMTAVETRSSCPVRIEREDYEAVGTKGIFPCGEGAGYAGGIMSSAVDGIKCAEAIASRLSLP